MRSILLSAFAAGATAACIPSGSAATVNAALQAGGAGAVVQLCKGAVISVTTASIQFTAADQELSTEGYPTDDTRATVIIQPGSTVGSAIWGRGTSGVSIRNVQVDGNRANAGLLVSDALIELGGAASGQVVNNSVIRNTRSWSCLHYINSGIADNPCQGGIVANNEIGPCGNEGKDANGNARWADGISFECANSVVTQNSITGATDGGIVIFGSPGSTFTGNTITTSDTDLCFGGFNMVDASFGGNYSNVVVSDNTIVGKGKGFFNLGIAIGSKVWSFNEPLTYFGPTTVTNNKFVGNLGFSIVINEWKDGLTVAGNDVSQVTSPSSSFADPSSCKPQVQTSFDANQELIVYAPSISGPSTLQPDFAKVPDNATVWLCLQHPLPNSASFAPGALTVTGKTSTVVDLHMFHVQNQNDANLLGYDTTGGVLTRKFVSSVTSSNCGADGSSCVLKFQGDGNLVESDSIGPLWHSGTAGTGQTVVFSNTAPYLEVKDASGATLWDITEGVKVVRAAALH